MGYDNLSAKAQALGLIVQPGIGTAYPALNAELMRLYQDRVAKLPWVPADWAAQVKALADSDPSVQLRLLPTKPYGVYASGAPAWLKANSQYMDAWQTLAQEVNGRVVNYAAKDAAANKPVLDELYANAAFWNSPLMTVAIDTQQVLRAVPEAVGNGAGTLVSDLAGSFFKKAWWVVALAVIGAIGYAAFKAGAVDVAVDAVRKKVAKPKAKAAAA